MTIMIMITIKVMIIVMIIIIIMIITIIILIIIITTIIIIVIMMIIIVERAGTQSLPTLTFSCRIKELLACVTPLWLVVSFWATQSLSFWGFAMFVYGIRFFGWFWMSLNEFEWFSCIMSKYIPYTCVFLTETHSPTWDKAGQVLSARYSVLVR